MPSKPKLLKSVGALFNDLGQLKNAYPNANKFFGALANNIKAVAPPNPMDTQASQEYAMNRAFDAPMLGAVKVYHGSPHKFDAFDMNKIGTGEGAQAYGHGLYFAESPEVAKEYQDILTRNISVNGETIVDSNKKVGSTGNDDIDTYLSAYLGDANKAIAALKSDYNDFLKKSERGGYFDYYNNEYQKNIKELQDLIDSNAVKTTAGGNLYETSLQWPDAAREAADPLGPQHFIDFDKPIGEQAQHIKDIIPGRPTQNPIKALYQAFNNGDNWAMEWAKQQGLNPYGAEFGTLTSDELATMYLKSKGIPGTKYLDQGSRGAGNGTYNYVVFDDNIPKIISVNGEPIFLK